MVRYAGLFRIDGRYQPKSNSIFIAESGDDLRRIGALRYSLYIDRDRKAYPSADRQTVCFIEPIDSCSLNLFGVAGGSCVTAVRVTKARLATEDEYLHRLLRNSSFDTCSYDSLAVVSRLAAAEHPESRALMTSALREAYRLALRNGIEFAVAATRHYLVPFFGRMGWAPSGQIYREAIAGEMHVLTLRLRDRAHLQSAHSIFLDLLDEFESEETIGASA
jgi:hypothetical protein